jgi:Zn-dependent metalloprotease
MSRRIAALALALVGGLLVAVPIAARSDDPGSGAAGRLQRDAHGRISLDRDSSGRGDFVGTDSNATIDNPRVDANDTVQAAARAHLRRYGASLGAAADTTFVQTRVLRGVPGIDVVRFGQDVAGVPVLGGEVVISMDAHRGLRSLSASVTRSASVATPSVTPARAERRALAVVRREVPTARVRATDQGRWVLDPEVARLQVPGGTRTVRRVEVGDGVGVRRMVLVDDHTGGIVADLDLVEHVDRVVCDRNNARGDQSPCTAGFVRTEASGASGIDDADHAFDYSGATSDFYQQIAHIDLTNLLGVDVGGVRKLASTVRFCPVDDPDPSVYDGCPFDNAFWNGQQMFYGAGYPAADDVVGHEMTHGVIDLYSGLFYWGQSGAINESMADVIGELIDHRNPTPATVPRAGTSARTFRGARCGACRTRPCTASRTG